MLILVFSFFLILVMMFVRCVCVVFVCFIKVFGKRVMSV